MTKTLLLAIFCSLTFRAHAADALDLFLSNDPVVVATAAFKAGDSAVDTVIRVKHREGSDQTVFLI